MNSVASIISLQSWGSIPDPKKCTEVKGASVLYYLAKAMQGKLKLEKKACEESVREQTIQSMIEKAVQNAHGITAKEELLEFFRSLFADSKNCALLKGWITGYYDSIVGYQNKIAALLSKYKQALAKLNREEGIESGLDTKAADAKAKMDADQAEANKYWKLAKDNWKHPAKAAYYAAQAVKYEAEASIQATAYAADETALKFWDSEIVKELRLVGEAKDKYEAKKDELIKEIKALMANSDSITPQQLRLLQQDFNELLTTIQTEMNDNFFAKACKWLSDGNKKMQKDFPGLSKILNNINILGPIATIVQEFGGWDKLANILSQQDKKLSKQGDTANSWFSKATYKTEAWFANIESWILKNVIANATIPKTMTGALKGISFVHNLPGYRLYKAMENLAQDGQKFALAEGAVEQLIDIMSKISANKLAQAIELHKEALQKYSTSSSDVKLISDIIAQSSTNSIRA